MKDIILKNIKSRLYIFILLFSILSILLINYTYLSFGIGIISFILNLIFVRGHKKLLFITIIICMSTLFVNCLNIDKKFEDKRDVFEDRNVFLGSYIYNEYGGKYVFEDNRYIQYSNSNISDNYCVGNYKYSYGGVSNDGVVIRQDDNYYYYNLELKEDYCIIMGIENYDKYEKKFVVAIDKFNNDSFIFINIDTESFFELKKIQEDE